MGWDGISASIRDLLPEIRARRQEIRRRSHIISPLRAHLGRGRTSSAGSRADRPCVLKRLCRKP